MYPVTLPRSRSIASKCEGTKQDNDIIVTSSVTPGWPLIFSRWNTEPEAEKYGSIWKFNERNHVIGSETSMQRLRVKKGQRSPGTKRGHLNKILNAHIMLEACKPHSGLELNLCHLPGNYAGFRRWIPASLPSRFWNYRPPEEIVPSALMRAPRAIQTCLMPEFKSRWDQVWRIDS